MTERLGNRGFTPVGSGFFLKWEFVLFAVKPGLKSSGGLRASPFSGGQKCSEFLLCWSSTPKSILIKCNRASRGEHDVMIKDRAVGVKQVHWVLFRVASLAPLENPPWRTAVVLLKGWWAGT